MASYVSSIGKILRPAIDTLPHNKPVDSSVRQDTDVSVNFFRHLPQLRNVSIAIDS